jgi:predicted dehydrogenase
MSSILNCAARSESWPSRTITAAPATGDRGPKVSPPLRVACCGLGYWGYHVARAFAAEPACRVVRLCDISPEALERARRVAPEASPAARFDEVVGDPAVEAVAVATPVPTHGALARAALEAGKHVFVEKPLAASAAEAEAVVAAASRAGRALMVGHLLLYHPAVEHLVERLAAGDLGEVRYLHAQRTNLGVVRADENALWSLAPHDISLFLRLAGALPDEVSATGGTYLQRGIADVAFFTLRFPGGVLAHGHVSWLDPHKVRRLTVVGSRKMAVFDDGEPAEKIRIYDKGVDGPAFADYGAFLALRSGDVVIPKVAAGEPLAREVAHFVRSVRERTPPRSDGADGLAVVRVLEALQRSLDSGGRPVPLA